LPTLRFTRDKRGYETTSLVHASRRQGRSRQQILYWFRTPPGVKVGRPALDEEAIRELEEHNPDIEFDWPRILEGQPLPAPVPEAAKERRSRRERPERRAPTPQPGMVSAAAPAPEAKPAEMPPLEAAPDALHMTPEQEPPEQELSEHELPEQELPEQELMDAFEQLTHPEAEETVEPPAAAIQQAMGQEQLMRLRARYAELQARITERGGDAARVEALRVEAEPLNPDTWVTEEETRRGLEEFDEKVRALRAALGLRRRRRSRRGRGGG
jgi:hypothetical protein